jgi:hypothetical protein
MADGNVVILKLAGKAQRRSIRGAFVFYCKKKIDSDYLFFFFFATFFFATFFLAAFFFFAIVFHLPSILFFISRNVFGIVFIIDGIFFKCKSKKLSTGHLIEYYYSRKKKLFRSKQK